MQDVAEKRRYTLASGAGGRGIAREHAEWTTGWYIKASVFKDLGVQRAARTIRRCGVTVAIVWHTVVESAGVRMVAVIKQDVTEDGRGTRGSHSKVGLRRSKHRGCAEKGLWGSRREDKKQESVRSAVTHHVHGSQSLGHCLVKRSSKMFKDDTRTH